MRFGMIVHTGKPEAVAFGKELVELFRQRGNALLTDTSTAEVLGCPHLGQAGYMAAVDVVLVLGGDGTLLSAARLASSFGKPVLGINMGHLGFLSELDADSFEPALERVLAGDFTVEERMMIEGRVLRSGAEIACFRALNDVVVTRGTFARIINVSTFIDNHHVVDYKADGIIVATPTGSTAYSLSAGGPIVEPLLECLCITPICPHTLASRSVVARPEAHVRLVLNSPGEEVMLTIDGQEGIPLESKDVVELVRAQVTAKFVKVSGRGFFDILNSRLREQRF
ncbi:MAG TPA: NAD(+)/NADH kinase [Firmicutes bacterium]|nr:NAD(+)/NADH kinase [Bacillota bacterium]